MSKHSFVGELRLSNGDTVSLTCYETVGGRVFIEAEGPARALRAMEVVRRRKKVAK